MSMHMLKSSSSIGSDALDQQIDRLFDEALGECGTSGDHWVPACNVRQDETGLYVQVALPGWDPSQVTLEVNDKMLTVKGRTLRRRYWSLPCA